jgi:hypothetical protein
MTYFILPRGGEPTAAEFFLSTATDRTPETTDAVDSDWSEQRWIKDGNGTVVGIDSRGRLKRGSLAHSYFRRTRYRVVQAAFRRAEEWARQKY